MPRLTRTGFAPPSIARIPSRTIACASTVAVVVPSPTTSLVLIAASLTSCAPMFSNWFFRWISRAIVTPSLVTTGDPVIFSRIALRPLGGGITLAVPGALGDEDGPAADPPRVQVGEGFGGRVQRIGPGMQGHPA